MAELSEVTWPRLRRQDPSRTLCLDEVTVLAAHFSRAFSQDPLISWFAPGAASRSGFFSALLANIDPADVQRSVCGAAVAVWTPSERLECGVSWQEVCAVPALLQAIGPLGLLRTGRFALAMASRHPRHPAHDYLMLLGVTQQARGRGLASQLLVTRLAAQDRAGRGAFLETANPANLEFYEAHGFETLASFKPFAGGPRLWSMWRAPKGAASA